MKTSLIGPAHTASAGSESERWFLLHGPVAEYAEEELRYLRTGMIQLAWDHSVRQAAAYDGYSYQSLAVALTGKAAELLQHLADGASVPLPLLGRGYWYIDIGNLLQESGTEQWRLLYHTAAALWRTAGNPLLDLGGAAWVYDVRAAWLSAYALTEET